MSTDKPVADDALPEPVAWLYEWGEGKLQASTSSPAEMLEWLDYAHVTPLVRGDDAVILISSLREHSTELLQAADHIRAGLEAELSTLRQRLADCARDAERYRWLRKMLNGDGFSQKDALLAACQDDMDAAIDAAIAAGAQK